MDIRSYLAATGRTQSEFAKDIGVTQSMVGHWLNGRCRIVAEKAVEIERATDHKISRHDLRPDVFGAVPPDSVDPKSRATA